MQQGTPGTGNTGGGTNAGPTTNPNGGNGATNRAPGAVGNGTCDPFRAVCPSYTDGTDQCDDVMQGAGQIILNSPNQTSFFYINENINVSISYTTNTNPQYVNSFQY